MAGVLLSSFPLGYLLLSNRNDSALADLSLATFPVFVVVGAAGLTTALYLLSFWHLSLLVVLPSIGLLWVLFFVRILRAGWNPSQSLVSIRSWLGTASRSHAVSFVFVATFSLIAISILLEKRAVTPPPGDPVSHGAQVALLVHMGGFHLSEIPLWNAFASATAYYPKGFHVMGAATTLFTGIYPAEGILVLGASVAFLLPLLVYAFVYLRTTNPGLATVGSLLIFLVPAAQFTVFEYNLYAYFVHGVYPFLYGLLFFLVALLLLYSGRPSESIRTHPGLLLSLSVIGVAILLTYYFFILLLAIFLLSNVLAISFRRKRPAWVHLMAPILGLGLLLTFAATLRGAATSFVRLGSPADLAVFWLPLGEFLSSPFSLIVIAALPTVLFTLQKGKNIGMSIGFLTFAVLMFVSMLDLNLYLDFLWFLAPRRSVIPLILLSSIVLLVFAWDALVQLPREKPMTARIGVSGRNRGSSAILLSLIFALVVFNINVYWNAEIAKWGFPQGDDYDAILWISQNVPEGDLILNDRSFVGLYLPAFGIKNVVHLRDLVYYPAYEGPYDYPFYMLQRIYESAVIFDDPQNQTAVHQVIQTWQIKYVFVSSERFYYDYWYDQRYELRNSDSTTLIALLNENPDFRPLFLRDEVGVYATFLTP